MAQFNLDRRQMLYIAGLLLLLVAVGFGIWFLYFRSTDEPTNTNQTPATNAPVETVNATIPTTNVNTAAPAPESVELTRVSNLFAERFGSYTSVSGFENMINLKPYMTLKMQQTADDFIKRQPAVTAETPYTEVVTKVVSTSITDQNSSQATVRLSTQRVESGDEMEQNTVYYQDIILTLQRADDIWLVDTATWQDVGVTAPDDTPLDSNVNTDDILDDIVNGGQ